MRKLIIIVTFVHCICINGQTKLSIYENIHFPNQKDFQKKAFVKSLELFLQKANEGNMDKSILFPSQEIETNILLDELVGIEYSRKHKDKHFYKPYLTNIIPLKDKYVVQVSYISSSKSLPTLRASFRFIVHLKNNIFLYSSPLVGNTAYWNVKKIENFAFFFKDTLNTNKAQEYVDKAKTFDEKLGTKDRITKIYLADNSLELLNLIGVDYMLDYNGMIGGATSSIKANLQLVVVGNGGHFNSLDPHDLWHDRLSLVIPRSKVNKPVDEACAYLYGGSWGMSWESIFDLFLKKVASDKKSDWMYYKENPKNFSKDHKTHLMVDYVVNALLVQKIEKEKGFSGVWKLLNCGAYEKGNENFYSTLSELISITKKNYNKAV